MAESWVKMRGTLLTNPKVIKMARLLLQDEEFLDWFKHDGATLNPSQAVTRRHVAVVTRIVVGALTPLWSQVNEGADRDAVLSDASLFEVDEMAGVPGLGRAMEAVVWLKLLPESKGIEFPNFTEHNTLGKERSTTAKTDAERAKEYRDRKKLKEADGVTNGVTEKCDESRDAVTTEKSREEKSNTSSLRSEVAAAKPRRTSRSAKPELTFADYLAKCKAEGVMAVPADHPVRSYCRDAGITDEMRQIAWLVFRDRHLTAEKAKRQKDWPATFANSVKGRWYKLWFVGENGAAEWTATGLQEKRVVEARLAAKHQDEREADHAPA